MIRGAVNVTRLSYTTNAYSTILGKSEKKRLVGKFRSIWKNERIKTA